jgi:20S proteasome alpha/beta subunit
VGFDFTRERVVMVGVTSVGGGGDASLVLASDRRRKDLVMVLKIVGDLVRVEEDGSVLAGFVGEAFTLVTTGRTYTEQERCFS